jgi:non-ribosomal peptide synthetase component E (peptide arylation enzyme)
MAADERWPLRQVPVELRERYLTEGWWTDDTLGVVVDRSLRAVQVPVAPDNLILEY